MELKKAYQEKANAQLHEWQTWIARYKADPILPTRSRRANPERVLKQLDDCYRIAELRLNELRNTHVENWDEAKEAVEQAMIELKRVLDESGAGRVGVSLRLQTHRSSVNEPFERKE